MSARLTRRALLASAAATLAAACRPSALRTIRLATLPRFTDAPFHLADERGFFRDEGLALEMHATTETTQMIPLLASGGADVIVAGATPALFNAILQGVPVRLVAVRDAATAGCTKEVYGRRASFSGGFTSIAQLKGKRVAVTAPTSVSAMVLDLLLQSSGLAAADVQLQTMRFAESTAALVAGRLDALVDLDVRIDSPDVVSGPALADVLPGFQYSFIQFGRTLLEGDVAIGAAFLRAYYRGVRAFRAGETPGAIERLAQSSGIRTDTLRAACRDRLAERGAIDAGHIQRIIDWARGKGFVTRDIDGASTIDRRFVERAEVEG